MAQGNWSEEFPGEILKSGNLNRVYLATDFDYALKGSGFWTPITLFKIETAKTRQAARAITATPDQIQITEAEYVAYKEYFAKSGVARPTKMQRLAPDPAGYLERPISPVDLGLYQVIPSVSYGAFRMTAELADSHLLKAFKMALEREKLGGESWRGQTWPIFKALIEAGLGHHIAVPTARGHAPVEFKALIDLMVDAGELKGPIKNYPRFFPMNHPDFVRLHMDGVGARKARLIAEMVPELDSHAAHAKEGRVLIIAEDKPEYLLQIGRTVSELEQSATFHHLRYILMNTGTQEQRTHSEFPLRSGYFADGLYRELPDTFLEELSTKAKLIEPTLEERKGSSHKNPKVLSCRSFL